MFVPVVFRPTLTSSKEEQRDSYNKHLPKEEIFSFSVKRSEGCLSYVIVTRGDANLFSV